jgi:hypothetical protein
MNIRKPILVILTLLTLAIAGYAVAQTNTTTDQGTTGTMDHSMDNSMEQGTSANDTANNPNVQTVTGVVVSFDNSSLVVRTSQGERTFNVLSSTVHPATMQANLPVVVEFVPETGGDRAVRVQENTQASAASQTPGGSVTGNTEMPGAANQVDHTGATGTTDTTSSTGSSYSGSTGTTGSTGSTYDQGTTGSTGTSTTGTGTTGSTDDSTTAGTTDTTGSMNDTTDTSSSAGTTDTTTGYQGSTLPTTGSDLPLVGLLGFAALGAAVALRFGRNA